MTDPIANTPMDMTGLQTQFDAAGNNLTFDASAVAEAVRTCSELIAQLDNAKQLANQLTNVTGLDKFTSIRTLSTGFGKRAGDGPGELKQVLQEHQDTVDRLRQALMAAGKSYEDTEAGSKNNFDAIIKAAKTSHGSLVMSNESAELAEIIQPTPNQPGGAPTPDGPPLPLGELLTTMVAPPPAK